MPALFISGDFGLANPTPYVASDVMSALSSLKSDSHWIVSLEGPIGGFVPSKKAGPTLSFPDANIEILRQCGVFAACLANNHIMDMGLAGLKNTLHHLERAGIRAIGTGRNISDALQPLVIGTENDRVAVLNLSEAQFGIATETSPGVADMESPDVINIIRRLKAEMGAAIVICHGGAEGLPLPPPQLRRLAYAWVESGADAVIFHHPHVLQPFELHAGTPIFYSLGNLCFSWNDGPPMKVPGMSVRLNFDRGKLTNWEWVIHEPHGSRIEIIGKSGQTGSASRLLEELNSALGAEYAHLWSAQCLHAFQKYYFPYFESIFSPPKTIRRRAMEKVGLFKRLRLDPNSALLWQVLVRCPSHRWMIEEALNTYGEGMSRTASPNISARFRSLLDSVNGMTTGEVKCAE